MSKPRLVLLATFLFLIGCGPTATKPYVPPEDLPTEMEDGESKLPEDGGP